MKNFRKPLNSLFVLAAAAALSACGPKIPDTLTIAVAQPLSGPQMGRGKDRYCRSRVSDLFSQWQYTHVR